MTDTAFHVEAAKADRFSRIYATSDGKLASPPNAQYLKKPNFLSGAAAWCRRPWTTCVLPRCSPTAVRSAASHPEAETVELMHTDHLPESVTDMGPLYRGNRFGLDFSIVTDPNPATDHERAKGEYWWLRHRRHLVRHQPGPGSGHRRHDPEPRFPCLAAARFTSKRLAYEAIVD